MRRLIYLIVLLTAAVSSLALNKFEVKFQQKIQMRDGVKISADLFLVQGFDEKQPALFVMTPYTTDGIFPLASYYAQHGYNVAVVDCRGRGNSEGEFMPFENDGRDGYDVCEWLAAQPWCNGKIGMFQGSYLGMAQWLTLKENPPSLKTIAPTASVCPGIDMPMSNNIFYTYDIQWLLFVYGKTNNSRTFTDVPYWNDVYRKYWTEHKPYGSLDEISGFESKAFQKWVLHPTFDKYYENILPSKEDYEKMNIPILNITGHFDDDQHGAMYYYENFLKFNKRITDKCFMVIGPWDHGGTRRPSTTLEYMTFSENSKIDIGMLHVQWFDWIMKNGPKPEFLKKNCAVYEMGTDKWKYSNSLQGFSKSKKVFYLSSDGKENSLYHSGKLTESNPEKSAFDSFKYNPLDTSDFSLRLQNKMINYSWREETEALLKDKLVFHTDPLSNDLTFTGTVNGTFYISMDAPDADFEAILYEIQPDGKCIYLTSDIMRARYRNGLKTSELIKFDKVYEYNFKSFYFTSRKMNKGSRLRLVIGCLNSPYFEKNYCSGKIVAYESAQDVITFTFRLFNGADYPSRIELPIVTDGNE